MNFLRSVLRLSAVATLVLASGALRAELKWDRLQESIEAKSWMAGKAVTFGFTNAGTAPVKILEVLPSCGCTAAQLSRTEIPPGERGEITAEFHPAGKSGKVTVTIRVHTDDAANPQTTLTVLASISEALQLTGQFIYWRNTEERVMRSIRITIPDQTEAEIEGVECTNPAYTAQLVPLETAGPTRTFDLRVTPPNEGVTFTTIVLRTKEGPAHTERVRAIVARTL